MLMNVRPFCDCEPRPCSKCPDTALKLTGLDFAQNQEVSPEHLMALMTAGFDIMVREYKNEFTGQLHRTLFYAPSGQPFGQR